MTELLALKDKWFIDLSLEDRFPPQMRHPGSKLTPYSDGNLVEPLIDGAVIMTASASCLANDRRPNSPIDTFSTGSSILIAGQSERHRQV